MTSPVTFSRKPCPCLSDPRMKKSLLHFQRSVEQFNAMNQIETEFQVTTDHMHAIVAQFVQEMVKGLDHQGTTVAMIPSFICGRPTGQEKGSYLALDLGGTNLRVCQVELLGQGQYTLDQQKYMISDQLKTSDMRHLCDFIAECVQTFLARHGHHHSSSESSPLELGFTFSFPLLQTSINSGQLKQWTKGFACTNAVGKDPALLLQDAFRRKNIQVNIAAIVNDAVGTLMAHAYRRPETVVGGILGTGSNTCYYEDSSQIKKKIEGDDLLFDEMVVNMEWGAFDCERRILPLTIYDNKINRESINVNEQLFEKMISGMYLGEVARNCMLHWIDRRVLFSGQSSSELNTQWRFDTAYLSMIEADESKHLVTTKHVLGHRMKLTNTTLADRKMVKLICHSVGRRAARLAACGLAAVLTKKNLIGQTRDDHEYLVAIDGSLFEFYPKFENNMMDAMIEMYGEKIRGCVRLELSKDGSSLGASVIAMMASKSGKNNT